MKSRFLLTAIPLLVVLSISAYLWVRENETKNPGNSRPEVSNFEECVAAGNPVMESYPRRCKTFTENIGNALEKQDLIQLTNPQHNEVVKSSLRVQGQARGSWFFEAQFPVKILDANGKVLGTAVATATGEWMTENFVPFTAEITFETSTTTTGTLVLERDNPSGLPQNDDSLRIPVKFK